MMKDKDESFSFFMIIVMLAVLGGFCFYFMYEIQQMRIDHKCYMMEDEEFFQTEMCKPYWSYRQVGKK